MSSPAHRGGAGGGLVPAGLRPSVCLTALPAAEWHTALSEPLSSHP